MEGHANKKDFFYIIVLILTFITVVIGMTFAIYYWIFSQEEGSSAVYTGTLSIDYLSGNLINFNLLYPIEKPSFDATTNVYRNDFKVTNTGSLDGIIDIEINVLTNEFTDNTLKYILFNSNGDELTSDYLNGTSNVVIAKNIVMKGSQSENFVLIIWLNENYENQNVDMRKYLTGSIFVNANQKRD